MADTRFSLPKKMTFKVPLQDDEIFLSDKKMPKIYNITGTITPRSSNIMDVVVKNRDGKELKGILKHTGHCNWEGRAGDILSRNAIDINMKYQQMLKRGFVNIYNPIIRYNPKTKETGGISNKGSAPLHIENADNRYISPKERRRIYFRQEKKDGKAAIKGSLTSIQDNALRKVQFSTNGENFKGEVSMPLVDLSSSRFLNYGGGRGYAIGDKGSLAEVNYLEQKGTNTFGTTIYHGKYGAWNRSMKERGVKTRKTKSHVIHGV